MACSLPTKDAFIKANKLRTHDPQITLFWSDHTTSKNFIKNHDPQNCFQMCYDIRENKVNSSMLFLNPRENINLPKFAAILRANGKIHPFTHHLMFNQTKKK